MAAEPCPGWKACLPAVLAAVVVTQILFAVLPRILPVMEARLTDQLFRLRARHPSLIPPYYRPIAHVDLNDTSIAALGTHYPHRGHWAAAVRGLAAMGADCQLVDLIMAAPSDPEEDRALIAAVRGAGTVFFGLAFDRLDPPDAPASPGLGSPGEAYVDRTRWHLSAPSGPPGLPVGQSPFPTFPDLAEASAGLGFLNILVDPDGVIRRLPLIVRYKDGYYPGFALRALCAYLRVPPERVTLLPGRIRLESARWPREARARDLVIPVDRQGALRINFLGPWGSMRHYNFADVAEAGEYMTDIDLWREELAGAVAVLSEVRTGSSDLGPVPTDTNFPLSGLHAGALNTILTERFIHAPGPLGVLGLELLIGILVLLPALRFSTPVFTAGSLAVGGLYVAAVAYFFLVAGWMLPILGPLFVCGGSMTGVTAIRFVRAGQERAALTRTLAAYFPPSLVRRFVSRPDLLSLSGEQKELSILFSDIQNFTGHTAAMAPVRVQELLNEYFEAMTEVVFRYGGTLDKFIGDGLMVFFGDPDPQPDHARRAVLAALDMQKTARVIRRRWEERGDMPLVIRIGINTDKVVVGNMGSTRRLAYSAIGAGVNLAQRLESAAPAGGILISERTRDQLDESIPVTDVGIIRVKGFPDPVPVHEVPVPPEDAS